MISENSIEININEIDSTASSIVEGSTSVLDKKLSNNKGFEDVQMHFFYEELIDGNSPIMSNYGGSRNNSDDERTSFHDVNSDIEFDNKDIVYIRPEKHQQFKKLSLKDIERSLDKYYNVDLENKYSTEIDILTTYVRGQKNLYIQSKMFTQFKLNILMILSLSFTTLNTVVTPFYCSYEDTAFFITVLNALASMIIALINYLKLESSTEKYLQIANEYDKMETALDVCNNKLLFMKNEEEKKKLVMQKIKHFEMKTHEIKMMCTVLIPKEVKIIFPVICHINIMTFIKKTEIYKQGLFKKLKDIKNEIRFILYKWDTEKNGGECSTDVHDKSHIEYKFSDFTKKEISAPASGEASTIDQFVYEKEKNRLHYLYNMKNTIRDELLNFRSTYSFLDDLFMKEIKDAESNRFFNYLPFCLLRSPTLSKEQFKDVNPVILKHFHSIGLISNM
jgi:hypothetical protein